MFEKMISLQLQMLLLILTGYILRKKKIISSLQQKGLSVLLIDLLLPANIINSFLSGVSFSRDIMVDAIEAIVICSMIQLTAIVSSPILFRPFEKKKAHVMAYGMIVSNSSFIGIPVAEHLFGQMATLFASLFQIPIRITMWTSGLSLFTEKTDLKTDLRRTFTHPCIIAVFIGIMIMLTDIHFPEFVKETIASLAKSVTPLSMIVIGMIISDGSAEGLFSLPVFYYCFFRLIAFPLFVAAVLHCFPIDPLIQNISILMSAMPCGGEHVPSLRSSMDMIMNLLQRSFWLLLPFRSSRYLSFVCFCDCDFADPSYM